MDFKEDQTNEVEALESIYSGELEVISTEPYHVFTIALKSDNYDNDDDCGILCELKFEYTANYPNEPPVMILESSENLEEESEDELMKYLQSQAEENLGMVMVFTIVSAAQEWINNKSDQLKLDKEELEEKKKLEKEEAEQKKFEGTRVTVETFLAWKKAFDIELGMLVKKDKDDKHKKLTGKELFIQDKSLNESDLKFLEEGGEFVKVDESLFQDLDDLEINESMSEED